MAGLWIRSTFGLLASVPPHLRSSVRPEGLDLVSPRTVVLVGLATASRFRTLAEHRSGVLVPPRQRGNKEVVSREHHFFVSCAPGGTRTPNNRFEACRDIHFTTSA